jgi:glycosyltransferase involved in cell wall biosynthesis
VKILHTVESYLPARHGMAEAVRQVSERLVRRGHEVIVATSHDPRREAQVIEGVRVEEFAVEGRAATGLAGETERYQKFLLGSDFDVVTNFAAQQWATDLVLPLLGEIRARKVFVPTGFSGLLMPEFRDYFRQMPRWMRLYDVNVFHSEEYRDARFAAEHGIDNVTLIPNGAAADEFLADPPIDARSRLGVREDELLILHVGDYTGSKGHLEAIEIFSRARLGDAVLVLVSGGWEGAPAAPPVSRRIRRRALVNRFRRKRVCAVALTRPETVAAFQAADLFLFPSNIECSPIVLFECLAARTPFLSTDVGNAREIIAWSGSGELLPTRPRRAGPPGWVEAEIELSARALERLAADELRRRAMAETGFAVWRERFTWERIAEQYEQLYEGLLS